MIKDTNNQLNGAVMKNQSEMVTLNDKKANVVKNRSFRKVYKKDNEKNYNLYDNKDGEVQDIKKKFNLTGEINFNSKTQKSAKTENKFYKSKKSKKDEPQSMNIYNLLQNNENTNENAISNQPIQLLKTRSKNTSFVKKKVSSFNKPLDKNFEIKLYQGRVKLLINYVDTADKISTDNILQNLDSCESGNNSEQTSAKKHSKEEFNESPLDLLSLSIVQFMNNQKPKKSMKSN